MQPLPRMNNLDRRDGILRQARKLDLQNITNSEFDVSSLTIVLNTLKTAFDLQAISRRCQGSQEQNKQKATDLGFHGNIPFRG